MKEIITFDELLEKIPNKYTLTITAGKRAREIGKGAPVLVEDTKGETITRVAFREILEDKITYVEGNEDLSSEE